ncbi:NADPH-dependent conjugated polyketone reductase C1 (CPR) (2-dehydropantolactone reductase (A-specific)) (Ketopantoyl-lactone reductase) [Durusdinium trenchii]|uniref:NADPH-dependent conjugated polyketone reductase C1 (CPR) (2-dehydropantolactone reductase (A-specific)) (Ketopantoyl-lactone reductase) n=1 Tax=Durusdinium trenchii TaxID=1381693 RepID=A0ABP0IVY4_9DINO
MSDEEYKGLRCWADESYAVGDLEELYIDALWCFHREKRALLSDDEFDELKKVLYKMGSRFPTLKRNEVAFVEASIAWYRGEPLISEEDFQQLKTEITASGRRKDVTVPRLRSSLPDDAFLLYERGEQFLNAEQYAAMKEEYDLLGISAVNLEECTLAQMEEMYVDALWAYYNDGTQLLSDEQFSKLKEELAWQGSGFPALQRKEVEFVKATLAYHRDEPLYSDEQWDELKAAVESDGMRADVAAFLLYSKGQEILDADSYSRMQKELAKIGVSVKKAGSNALQQTINITSGKLENDVLQVTSSSRTAYTDVPRASLVVPEVAIGQSTMPAIAFGVGSRWLEDEDREERLKRSIHSALDAGFRHLDDAEAYGMQELLGEAIHEWMEKSGAKREELFMTSKVWSLDGDIVAKCRQLLKDSRLDYFDLLLVHCACTEAGDPFKKPLPAIWEEMMSIKQSGLAKEIGVSNWRIQDLESIKDAEIQPVCNQVEAHVFLQQVGLREYCRRRNIVMTCYGAQAPVARLECLDEAAPLLQEALAKSCERHGRNVGQILLRWAYQNDLITVTTSTKIERIRQSLEIFDFELSQEEIGEMLALSQAGAKAPMRRFFWPDLQPGFWASDPASEIESRPWAEIEPLLNRATC